MNKEEYEALEKILRRVRTNNLILRIAVIIGLIGLVINIIKLFG